jgi:hypothetical protein
MHVHSRVTAGILSGPARPEGPGWRLEVNLERGKYRWVRRYGSKRQWTPYRPLAELPPERIAAARAESLRQRAARNNVPYNTIMYHTQKSPIAREIVDNSLDE